MPLLIVGIGTPQVTEVTVFVAQVLTLGRVKRVLQLVGNLFLHRLISIRVVPPKPWVWSQQFKFLYSPTSLLLGMVVKVLILGKVLTK